MKHILGKHYFVHLDCCVENWWVKCPYWNSRAEKEIIICNVLVSQQMLWIGFGGMVLGFYKTYIL